MIATPPDPQFATRMRIPVVGGMIKLLRSLLTKDTSAEDTWDTSVEDSFIKIMNMLKR